MKRLILITIATILALLGQLPLSPEEQRGRQIYERGTTDSGSPITASMGADNTSIPGPILPCANCHGHDGRGKPESGIVPSDITWDALTKPYGVTHAGGRTHPPYNERLFKRAVTLGVDAGGNSLENAMPRFQLTNTDFADLMTYVKRLGQNREPGLTGTSIRVGVILPPDSPMRSKNAIVRQALLGNVARLNAAGGVFGRRIELSFLQLPRSLSSDNVFALIGDSTSTEAETDNLIRETGTPAVFAASGPTAPAFNPYAFYIDRRQGGESTEDPAAVRSRALATLEVVIEGLKRAGRDVSRESLVGALEGLYRFETRVGSVSFGPKRRVGLDSGAAR